MTTPFPGMDPYLEQRGLWEQVHTRLIVAIADELTPLVAPRYRVDIEQRTYLGVLAAEQRAGIPDASVMEPSVRRMREAALAYPIEPDCCGPENPWIWQLRRVAGMIIASW